MAGQLYKFCWGNNLKRRTMKGRICRVIDRAKKMNSCMIEFIDNGQRECVSRNSLRKAVTDMAFKNGDKVTIIKGRMKGEVAEVIGESNLNMENIIIVRREKGIKKVVGFESDYLRR